MKEVINKKLKYRLSIILMHIESVVLISSLSSILCWVISNKEINPIYVFLEIIHIFFFSYSLIICILLMKHAIKFMKNKIFKKKTLLSKLRKDALKLFWVVDKVVYSNGTEKYIGYITLDKYTHNNIIIEGITLEELAKKAEHTYITYELKELRLKKWTKIAKSFRK